MSLSWSALHAQLFRSTERLSFQHTFDLMRGRHSELSGLRDIADLLDHQQRPDGNPNDKNAVLVALAREAIRNSALTETAVTVVVLCLWPGLDAVHGRLIRYFRSEPDRLATEILGRVSLGIRGLDLTRVSRIAATLVRNVERDIRRSLRREWAESAEPLPDDVESGVEEVSPASGIDGDRLIARLRVILGSDAALVLAIAVEGLNQREAAEKFGLGYDATRKRYQRALHRFRSDLIQ